MNQRTVLCAAIVVLALASSPRRAGTQASLGSSPATIEKGDFRFSYDERGISALANPHDPIRRDPDAGLRSGRPSGP